MKNREEFSSPLSTTLALKLVLNFFLYRKHRGYAVLHYVVYTRRDLYAMVGKAVNHSVIAGSRAELARQGYVLLELDANRFLLIRLAQLSHWTKLSARFVKKLPNDERLLRNMLEQEREAAFVVPEKETK